MSSSDDSNVPNQDLTAILTAAKQKLDEIETLKKQLESDASAVAQLKQRIEESAAFVSQKKGDTEADYSTITAQKRVIDEFSSSLSATNFAEIRQKLEEVETLRQKAQSEANFAFQAKQHCEEHFAFISQKKGQVEADFNGISANKASIEEFAATIPANKVAAENDLKALAERKREADEHLQQIAERRKKVEIDQQAADKARTEIDGAASEIKTLLQSSQTSSNTASKSASIAVQLEEEIKNRSAATAALAESARQQSTAAEEMSKQASKHAAATETTKTAVLEGNKRLADLLAELEKLKSESEILRSTVEKLLPGATSAGLAASFREQGRRFKLPQVFWISCFILCMGGLYYTAYSTAAGPLGTMFSWDTILIETLHRLPFLVPLVWFAIYAARKGMLAARLEEDYAYKEALSHAFEGYKAQMQGIPGKTATDNPLLLLCNNALNAIADNPGRIYDRKLKDITIPNELLAAAVTQAELLKNTQVAK
jgi:chromosome segregation ATPase